jgi:two-component sensor histidine kinase
MLLAATASGDAQIDAYEMDLKRLGQPSRQIIVQVRNLPCGADRLARLLVAVHDATEERSQAKRGLDLARDNAMLMQETRHRIANSLQIIASVIMMNARRASSEETRGYLRDAHHRVMSVAELQRQLAVSNLDRVSIGGYLTRLCETISASMIGNPEELAIRVDSPDITVAGDVSVSLGLIVTELVINALKHAFPRGGGGRINVGYTQDRNGWTLTVGDDGVGMAAGVFPSVAGLGTGIVRALAEQLGARVELEDRDPGTRVLIVHEETIPRDGRLAHDAPEPAV